SSMPRLRTRSLTQPAIEQISITTRCGSRSTIRSCRALGVVNTVTNRCLPVSASYSQATVLNLPRSNANILIVRVSLFELMIEPFPTCRDKLVLKQLDFIQLTLPGDPAS